jgi:hypothetical protein
MIKRCGVFEAKYYWFEEGQYRIKVEYDIDFEDMPTEFLTRELSVINVFDGYRCRDVVFFAKVQTLEYVAAKVIKNKEGEEVLEGTLGLTAEVHGVADLIKLITKNTSSISSTVNCDHA